MKKAKTPLVALLVVASFALTGCDSKVPGDEIASKGVMKFAQQDICNLPDVEIVDFKRANGWVDQQNPSQYDVRYDYNVKLTKPLAGAVLDAAKQFQASQGDIGEADALATYGWIGLQAEKFKERVGAFVAGCQECGSYMWGQESTEQRNILAFTTMWKAYENCGFADDAKGGAKLPRQAWAGFTKTEQGWMPVTSLAMNGSVSTDQVAANALDNTAQVAATPQINPANGQPMVPGGAVDVLGNPYGTGAPSPVNPANGQPMVPGAMIDVQGNAFGTAPPQ